MAKKTFMPDKTGKVTTNLAGCLQKEYAAINSTDFSGQYTIEKKTIFVIERDRYAKGDKQGRIGDPNLIPLFEISNKMHEGSPILFVGMNPSGTDVEHYKDYDAHYKSSPHQVFIYDGDSTYYRAMRKFAFECLQGIEPQLQQEEDAEGFYSELDLFGIVQSTQEIVQKDFLADPDKYGKLFDIFLDYVKRINPKVIIVANAFVRRILQQPSPKFTVKKNEEFGGYTFKINSMEDFKSQLYFSSMLSGQRALDKGSWENLVWLVRNFLRK